ncbi:MAG: IPTL-CTERM sorting domain-containing protein [Thermodesulfobacteriota bacterium]
MNPETVLSVNPTTGVRQIITEYDNPGQGALGGFGEGIIIATVATEMITQLVPTLSEWGLIAMASILGIVGFMVIRRRKVTA